MIPSAIIHEYMHGWMADRLGDPTARYAGRLSLNPKVHIDPIGTVLMPIILYLATAGGFVFAYAKPVPFNPHNLRNQKWGPVMVALAGPLSNLFLALVFGLMVQFMPYGPATPFLGIIVFTNVLLAVFNAIPIPPLDGSKLLFAIMPPSMDHIKHMLNRFGFFFVILFMLYGWPLVSPLLYWLVDFFTGGLRMF